MATTLAQPAPPAATTSPAAVPARLASLDAYRGFHHAAADLPRLRLRRPRRLSPVRLARPPGRPRRVGRLHLLGPHPARLHLHGRYGDAVRLPPTRRRGRGLRQALPPRRVAL